MSDSISPERKPRDDEMDTYGLSNVGLVRTENQDHFLMGTIHKRTQIMATNLEPSQRPPEGEQRLAFLAMVADGVGGGTGGGEASATALEAVMRFMDDCIAAYYAAKSEAVDFANLLQDLAMRTHQAVLAKRAEQGIRGTMATTLTLYIGVWPTYYLLQLGDSRYYVWRKGKLMQITRDQTVAQYLVDEGVLTRTAAARTPLANVLSSALGAENTSPVVTQLQADWHNVHLLCSDGLTKHVTDERIAEVLGSMTSAQQACELLLKEALENGGSDNVTIIVGRTVPKDVA